MPIPLRMSTDPYSQLRWELNTVTNKPKEFEQSITLTSNHFITSDPLRTVCLEAAGINAYTD